MAKKTTSDPFAGTSAVQHATAEAALTKSAGQTRAGIAPKAIGTTNVSSMFWGMHVLLARGTNAWNFGFPAPVQVFANSQVSVTMTEVDNNDTPFLGAAPMQVFNVVPQQDGTVTVLFNVGWSESLRVLFNFIIVN
jgi:hypothetical protein